MTPRRNFESQHLTRGRLGGWAIVHLSRVAASREGIQIWNRLRSQLKIEAKLPNLKQKLLPSQNTFYSGKWAHSFKEFPYGTCLRSKLKWLLEIWKFEHKINCSSSENFLEVFENVEISGLVEISTFPSDLENLRKFQNAAEPKSARYGFRSVQNRSLTPEMRSLTDVDPPKITLRFLIAAIFQNISGPWR